MTYCYDTERDRLFTDEGQRMLLRVRDNVVRLLRHAGAFQAQKAWTGVTGSSWMMMACLDRLVELDEIKKIHIQCSGQYEVCIEAGRRDD